MRQTYRVEQYVTVEVDEDKFTPEFMEEFRASFYPYGTVEDHMQSLAILFSSGVYGPLTNFIEGYGNPADFGIKWFEASPMTAEREGF